MTKEVGGARTTLADLDERQLRGRFWTVLSRGSFDGALSFGNVKLGATGSIQRFIYDKDAKRGCRGRNL